MARHFPFLLLLLLLMSSVSAGSLYINISDSQKQIAFCTNTSNSCGMQAFGTYPSYDSYTRYLSMNEIGVKRFGAFVNDSSYSTPGVNANSNWSVVANRSLSTGITWCPAEILACRNHTLAMAGVGNDLNLYEGHDFWLTNNYRINGSVQLHLFYPATYSFNGASDDIVFFLNNQIVASGGWTTGNSWVYNYTRNLTLSNFTFNRFIIYYDGGHDSNEFLQAVWIENSSALSSSAVDGNQLPTCALSYAQNAFYASNSTQYFDYNFSVNDPEGDQLYYSLGQQVDQGVYVANKLDFTTFSLCSDPHISSPGNNLSCATDWTTQALVTQHLIVPGMTISSIDSTPYLFLTEGSVLRYTLDKALIQDGTVEFGMALQNGNVVNVSLINGIGQEVYSLLFNQSNDWLNVSNGTAIVISMSSTAFSSQHRENWVSVTIGTYPNTSTIKTSVITSQDAGKIWSTTNGASLYSVQWNTPLGQMPWYWLMLFAKFIGFEYDPHVYFTTTAPDGHMPITWVGGQWLNFYGSDAYHQPLTYCKKDVYVTMASSSSWSDNSSSVAVVPSGSPIALTPMGGVGGVFYGLIHSLNLENTLYPYGWLAYLIFLLILFLSGMELGGAWAVANVIFFIFGLFSLVSWGQTLSCLVMFLISVSGALTKQFGPFGGVGGGPFQKSQGFEMGHGGKED